MRINEYLLQFLSAGNKEAAIPGLGVFYTDLRNTISFREVAPTDKTFISYVAKESGVDEIAVASSIDVWVKSILQDLKTTGRSVIEEIGCFEVGNNKVVFTPEAQEIYITPKPTPMPEPEVKEFTPAEKPADTFGMDEEENDPYTPRDNDFADDGEPSFTARNLWWIVTVSIVLIGIIIVFLIPQTREGILSTISGNGQEEVQEIVLGTEENTDEILAEEEENDAIAEEVVKGEKERIDREKPAASTAVTAPSTSAASSGSSDVKTSKAAAKSEAKSETKSTASTSKKPAAAKATQSPQSAKYNIIAGTYKERANADKEIKRFHQMGYSGAKVVSSGGFYYISLKEFLTKDEAIEYKLKLREKNIDGWVKQL
ncbi:MAG: SPOR domain-containing protein [Bacteroidales bacterium]|jgi:hypothetical protein|nr:SPOR domain-containing protein [Bacteroidales bacterium]